jgi:hypothetical protein
MRSYKNLLFGPEKEGFEIKDAVKPLLPVSLPSYEFGLIERSVTLGCVQSEALMTGENVRPGFYREPTLFVENNNYLLKEVT